MALETREEFLEEWRQVATKLLGEEADPNDIEQAGNELYDARVLAWAVAEDDLNVTAHRYFHGVGSVALNFMMQLPLPDEVAPFLVGEYMFHAGFVAGMAHVLDTDKVGLGMVDRDDAVKCLGPRDTIVRTREELETHLMPAPIETVQELQGMIEEMAESMPKAEPEGEGSPIVPPEGGEGYF